MLAHAFNTRTPEAETGRFQKHIVRPRLKKCENLHILFKSIVIVLDNYSNHHSPSCEKNREDAPIKWRLFGGRCQGCS